MGRLNLHQLSFSTSSFFTQHFAVAGLSPEPGSAAWELQEEGKGKTQPEERQCPGQTLR